MNTGSILWFTAIAGFFGAMIAWSSYAMKKRQEALAAVLAKLGFSHSPESREPSSLPLAELDLFQRGRLRHCRNIGRLKLGNEEFIYCDYSYTTGTGKNKHHHLFSCLVRIGRQQLPDFTLSPEDVFSRIAQAVGYQDIDFSFDEEFSKSFVLRGKDEQRVRSLFNPDLLHHVKAQKKIRIEASGDKIVCYSRFPIAPEELANWIEESKALLSRFNAP